MTSESVPNGKASIREVYTLVQEVRDDLADLRGCIEHRIDRLERWRSYLTGAGAVVSVGLTWALWFVRSH